MQLERRFIRGGQVRAKQGDKPGIEGVASVYTQDYDTGWFVERIAQGAFDRALSEKQDVRCLFNHDVNNVLGRTKSGTLRLSNSKGGLGYDCDTDPNTTVGRDVPAMIDRGDVDGCSFSFNVRKDNWSDEFDAAGKYVRSIRVIEDLDLFDVGPVTFPAYTDTSVGTRSAQWPDGAPIERRSHIEALRSAAAVKLTRATRDDSDDDSDGDINQCTCPCDPCGAGDCDDCSHDDCACQGCTCDSAMNRSLILRARAHVAAGA